MGDTQGPGLPDKVLAGVTFRHNGSTWVPIAGDPPRRESRWPERLVVLDLDDPGVTDRVLTAIREHWPEWTRYKPGAGATVHGQATMTAAVVEALRGGNRG